MPTAERSAGCTSGAGVALVDLIRVAYSGDEPSKSSRGPPFESSALQGLQNMNVREPAGPSSQ
jgi:hypothetical protein